MSPTKTVSLQKTDTTTDNLYATGDDLNTTGDNFNATGDNSRTTGVTVCPLESFKNHHQECSGIR